MRLGLRIAQVNVEWMTGKQTAAGTDENYVAAEIVRRKARFCGDSISSTILRTWNIAAEPSETNFGPFRQLKNFSPHARKHTSWLIQALTNECKTTAAVTVGEQVLPVALLLPPLLASSTLYGNFFGFFGRTSWLLGSSIRFQHTISLAS